MNTSEQNKHGHNVNFYQFTKRLPLTWWHFFPLRNRDSQLLLHSEFCSEGSTEWKDPSLGLELGSKASAIWNPLHFSPNCGMPDIQLMNSWESFFRFVWYVQTQARSAIGAGLKGEIGEVNVAVREDRLPWLPCKQDQGKMKRNSRTGPNKDNSNVSLGHYRKCAYIPLPCFFVFTLSIN